jgi:hypothetical protein
MDHLSLTIFRLEVSTDVIIDLMATLAPKIKL